MTLSVGGIGFDLLQDPLYDVRAHNAIVNG